MLSSSFNIFRLFKLDYFKLSFIKQFFRDSGFKINYYFYLLRDINFYYKHYFYGNINKNVNKFNISLYNDMSRGDINNVDKDGKPFKRRLY